MNRADQGTENSQNSFWTTFLKLFFKTLTLPPYYTLLFLSSVLVILSVLNPANQFFSNILLLYSVAGVFWRHAIKNLQILLGIEGRERSRKITCRENWIINIVYHSGNVALFYALLKYLKIF